MQITITDISEDGDGIGRYQNKVVFVPGTVPDDVVTIKITQEKPNYLQGKLLEIIKRSPDRVIPYCIVADKCGGCQWQFLRYEKQLEFKQKKVRESLLRIGKFSSTLIEQVLQPIIPAHHSFNYRNKVAFPLGISEVGAVKAGYFQHHSHRLINLNKCPVQDDRLNIFLQKIKQDIQSQGWQIYDEKTHQGLLRHLLLRIGRHTGEILLTLVSKQPDLPNLYAQAEQWLKSYEGLVGVTLNINPQRTNAILGADTKLIIGQDFIREQLLEYTFQLRSDTFFQVHTEQAEQMIEFLIANLRLSSENTLLDAYAGIGTIAICLAKFVRSVIAIEIQPQATQQGQSNAELNNMQNVKFMTGKVEEILPELTTIPDVVILDPPRKGCQPEVITALRRLAPTQIAYVSCNPATLARDLELLCQDDRFHLRLVQPFDFFPQTAHVECVALLESNGNCMGIELE